MVERIDHQMNLLLDAAGVRDKKKALQEIKESTKFEMVASEASDLSSVLSE